MKQLHFYDAETGLLHGNSIAVNGPEDTENEMVLRNCPDGHKPIEGNLHPLQHRVDVETGKVIDYQPPAPSKDHEWNAEAKRWHLTAAALGKLNRSNAARARITQLENSQHRHIREHALGKPGALEQLQAIDDEIFSQRSQLQ